MIQVRMPRQFNITLDNGQVLRFPGPGIYQLEDEMAEHPVVQQFVVSEASVVKAEAIPHLAVGHADDPNRNFAAELAARAEQEQADAEAAAAAEARTGAAVKVQADYDARIAAEAKAKEAETAAAEKAKNQGGGKKE